MTVYFPDSPGDCPTGMNLSVISCAEGAGGPPPRNTLIPTSATTNLRMVIRSPSSPSFDEERSRLLLLSDRLLRVPPSEEETPDGLVLEPPCLPEVGDGLRVKAAAPQHPDAVVRLASGAGEQSLSLRGGYGAARLQQLDALSDVLEYVDDPQESGDRHDLRPIELDTLAVGVDLRQRLARRRIVERLAVVEADRAFDGLDGIVVEERPGVRRLHQRRNIERAVARRAEPVVRRDPLARQASWLIGQILHTGVEDLPDQPARLTGKRVPPDDGFRSPGDGTFNIPPLVEAADTGPFFHNNAIETIEGAVAFYDGEAFNNSPAGRAMAKADPKDKGVELDGTQIVAIAAFLRVINVLENIRQSIELLETSRAVSSTERQGLLARAARETDDSIRVLRGGGLHAEAVAHLREARRLEDKAVRSLFFGRRYAQEAIREQKKARAFLVE